MWAAQGCLLWQGWLGCVRMRRVMQACNKLWQHGSAATDAAVGKDRDNTLSKYAHQHLVVHDVNNPM